MRTRRDTQSRLRLAESDRAPRSKVLPRSPFERAGEPT